MINQYPLWKNTLIVLALVMSVAFALPNLWGEDPAVQITASRGAKLDSTILKATEDHLKALNIPFKIAVLENKSIKIRFPNTESQLKARDQIERKFYQGYTIALTLLPATPDWLRSFGSKPMSLGLDLRGGVHFLLQVDMKPIIEKTEKSNADSIRRALQKKRIRYKSVIRQRQGGIKVRFVTEAVRDQAAAEIRKQLPGLKLADTDDGRSFFIIATLSLEELKSKKQGIIEKNMDSLRKRVDELGVAEPIIQQQGLDRIVIQLPGVQDTAAAKRIIGRTATLEAKMVDHEHNGLSPISKKVPLGSKLYYRNKDERTGVRYPILLLNRTIYSGDNIVDARASFDSQTSEPIVSITLDSEGAASNRRVTGRNINKHMAIILIERRLEPKLDENDQPMLDKNGRVIKEPRLVEEVITAPRIKSTLGSRFQIEGGFTVQTASELALLLRAGSLAAPMDIIEERTIGPSLGKDNIDQGFQAIVIGFIAVLLFMLVYYRVFGIIANVALIFNLMLLIAVLSMTPAVLTLPGIAGILLTIGMAVDANVLIFERIREELRNGNTPQASIHAGYEKAFSTIADANITTLIAAIMLFNFGTGPIKGFAVTLSIGIVTSMFTTIFAARGLTNLIYGGRQLRKLSI